MATIAQIVPDTEAEGPGRRFAIWFQGCPLRCPGCCNPEFLPFHGGESLPVQEIVERIRTTHGIEGISLLGGEPFAHALAAAEIATAARSLGLSVMVYTGYELAELRQRTDAESMQLLSQTDVLVDGPYRREQPDSQRRWIGSTNQKIHFFTNRYSPTDPCWTKPNTLELRIRGNEISVNGFPASQAKGLWKGWTRKSVPHG
ncbi:MAG: 4Fe-4S single cluster domain-containing protein [Gemmataceae bacterium]